MPSGVPIYILPIVIPIEIISNFLVRPVTHSLRLFATMLAGHLIVMIAGSGIEFLIMQENVLSREPRYWSWPARSPCTCSKR